jgi:phosphoribosyl 1,2-cyclic phosphodiesterase
LRFWGTRGSVATPGSKTCRHGGNTSSLEIEVAGRWILCDAGTGLRALGLDWLERERPAKAIELFLSHTHFDHIQGFTFFAPAFRKDVTITVYDPTEQGSMRDRLLGQLLPEYCPVMPEHIGAKIESRRFKEQLALGTELLVRAWPQPHPAISWAYAFESRGRRIIYATDNELDAQLLNPGAADLSDDSERRFPPELIERYRDADLVIADAQYTSAEYKTRVGWGHPRFATVVDLALAANVKRLALSHHDPQHDDDLLDDLVLQARARAAAKSTRLEVFAAIEGATVTV